MIKISRRISLLLILVSIVTMQSCLVVVPRKDNGKHKGWTKNSHNPHHPNTTNPGHTKSANGNAAKSSNGKGNSGKGNAGKANKK